MLATLRASLFGEEEGPIEGIAGLFGFGCGHCDWQRPEAWAAVWEMTR